VRVKDRGFQYRTIFRRNLLLFFYPAGPLAFFSPGSRQ
jgi:hypothetical protein